MYSVIPLAPTKDHTCHQSAVRLVSRFSRVNVRCCCPAHRCVDCVGCVLELPALDDCIGLRQGTGGEPHADRARPAIQPHRRTGRRGARYVHCNYSHGMRKLHSSCRPETRSCYVYVVCNRICAAVQQDLAGMSEGQRLHDARACLIVFFIPCYAFRV
jgi:hypothetical protein